MGKKRDRQVQHDESDLEEMDPELEEEMQALKAMQREKQRRTERDESERGEHNNEGQGNDEEEDSNDIPNRKYNKEALIKSTASLETAGLPFEETMLVCSFPIDVTDEHNDLEREMAFYNQTLLSVRTGKERMKKLGIPIKRPQDYFCEQVKSDNHMAKIKDKLILEEKKIDAFEKRKNREHQRKFNKQVADLKKQNDAKRRKENIDEFGGLSSRGRKIDRSSDPNKPGKGKKRLAMDRKYGKGEKNMKRGNNKTLNDFSSYNPRGGSLNRRPMAKGAAGKTGGKVKVNRPGKASRQKHRAARSA